MHVPPDARTTPQLRLHLVTCVEEGEPVEEVATALGLSRSTVYNWIATAAALRLTTGPQPAPTPAFSPRTGHLPPRLGDRRPRSNLGPWTAVED